MIVPPDSVRAAPRKPFEGFEGDKAFSSGDVLVLDSIAEKRVGK